MDPAPPRLIVSLTVPYGGDIVTNTRTKQVNALSAGCHGRIMTSTSIVHTYNPRGGTSVGPGAWRGRGGCRWPGGSARRSCKGGPRRLVSGPQGGVVIPRSGNHHLQFSPQ